MIHSKPKKELLKFTTWKKIKQIYAANHHPTLSLKDKQQEKKREINV
jgi:hypothetical protein